MPKPPPLVVKADAYARGARLYERNCTVCHGVAALSGGVLPDLRRSVRLQDAVAFRRAVVDGELAPLGMPRFGKYVSAAGRGADSRLRRQAGVDGLRGGRQMNAAATK